MYRALYRKWRPNQFDDVVGQQHITQTLRNELVANKLAHAYLFTGSRGTGKTTCAKILAKAVNCEHMVDGNPCNECEVCRGIDSGAILDVVEIDAASNNGVDNIRDLREETNYTPVRAKYRVYIIDEVHMLSIGAFNALLKTLEEPPEYVKFILATTEVHKLPATILSRCQRFDFKRIEPEDIAERLATVAEGENITLEREAALLIARVADGALRDALSLLDQCAGQSDTVTADLVSRVAGLTGREHLFRLAECIRQNDCAGALTVIDELHTASCDMERLCAQLIEHYRNLMIIRAVNRPSGLIVCTSSELELLEEQAKGYTLEGIMHILSVLEEAAASMRKGANRRIEAELAFVKLCTPNADTSVESLLRRVAELEKAVRSGVTAAPAAPQTEPAAPAPAAKPLPNGECAAWADILQELKTVNMPMFAILADSSARVQDQYLVIASPNPSVGAMLKTGSNAVDLKKAVFSVTGCRYKICVERPSEPPVPLAQEDDPLISLLKEAEKMGVEIQTT